MEMATTVTVYPFGQPLKIEVESLEAAFKQIEAYHKLTNGNADYEIEVREEKK